MPRVTWLVSSGAGNYSPSPGLLPKHNGSKEQPGIVVGSMLLYLHTILILTQEKFQRAGFSATNLLSMIYAHALITRHY